MSMPEPLRDQPGHFGNVLRQGLRLLADQDPVDLILRLTLVMTLLFPGDLWFHRIYMRILAVLGFIYLPLLRKQWYWFLLFGLNLSVQNLYNWAASDNHKWLYSYWYLAVGLSVGSADPRQVLAVNGRLLIGLVFFFATLRKLLAPEYFSGDAFRFLLLVDGRFFEVSKLIGGHSQDAGSIWRAMRQLDPIVSLPATPRVDWLAWGLTWWTICIEATIAALFLIKEKFAVVRLGDLVLLLFVATTYSIAPVLGFAWVLLIMGCAQCRPERRKTRFAYLAVFALVYAFHGQGLKTLLVKWFFGEEFFALVR